MIELKEYFLQSLCHIQGNKSEVFTDCITLGGRIARLTTYSNNLRDVFFPSLMHLKIQDSEQADMQLYYVSDQDLEYPLLAPNWGNVEFNAQGYAAELDQEDIGVYFQPWLRQIFLYSYTDKIGIYWVKDVEEIPWWEPTFSFRAIFHMWTRDTYLQLMHAGAIASNDRKAFLFPAQSGSGKSTTTCTLFEEGYHYLGDDYILVDTDRNIVYKLYGTTKMEWDNLESRFPHLLSATINSQVRPNQKGILYLGAQNSSIISNTIHAVIVPILGSSDSGFSRSTVPNSIMAVAPTTLHHLPHHRNESYKKIKKLLSKTPNFIWRLPKDKKHIIQQFHTFQNESIGECYNTDV